MWFDTALKGEVTAVLLLRCSASLPPVGVSSGPGSARVAEVEERRREEGDKEEIEVGVGRKEGGKDGGREASWVEQREALCLHPLMR